MLARKAASTKRDTSTNPCKNSFIHVLALCSKTPSGCCPCLSRSVKSIATQRSDSKTAYLRLKRMRTRPSLTSQSDTRARSKSVPKWRRHSRRKSHSSHMRLVRRRKQLAPCSQRCGAGGTCRNRPRPCRGYRTRLGNCISSNVPNYSLANVGFVLDIVADIDWTRSSV